MVQLRGVGIVVIAVWACTAALSAQRRPSRPSDTSPSIPGQVATVSAAPAIDTAALNTLRWRELGPFRGGRSAAVAGSVARPMEYWMGTTGGGVFKSTDAGQSWAPMTDKYFGGTVGAIAVAPSNPDIVYVGGGEAPIRGSISPGLACSMRAAYRSVFADPGSACPST